MSCRLSCSYHKNSHLAIPTKVPCRTHVRCLCTKKIIISLRAWHIAHGDNMRESKCVSIYQRNSHRRQCTQLSLAFLHKHIAWRNVVLQLEQRARWYGKKQCWLYSSGPMGPWTFFLVFYFEKLTKLVKHLRKSVKICQYRCGTAQGVPKSFKTCKNTHKQFKKKNKIKKIAKSNFPIYPIRDQLHPWPKCSHSYVIDTS